MKDSSQIVTAKRIKVFVSNNNLLLNMIFQEYLKKYVTMTTAAPYNLQKSNIKAVRTQHSPFGDFPKEMMPKKETIDEPEPIEVYATSIGITGNSKRSIISGWIWS